LPTLRHLIEELQRLSVDPNELRLPGQMYDALVDQVEDIADEEQEEED